MSDQLIMKSKENAKRVSDYPFRFLEKKHPKPKFQNAHTDEPIIAISGMKQTVTTRNGRIIHRKCISKPIIYFDQNCNNNRGTGPKGSDGRFTRSPSKQKKVYKIESDNEPEAPPPERSSPMVPKQTDKSFGQEEHVYPRQTEADKRLPQNAPGKTDNTVPLTITTANMTDT